MIINHIIINYYDTDTIINIFKIKLLLNNLFMTQIDIQNTDTDTFSKTSTKNIFPISK